MAVKFLCTKCDRKFVDWGADKVRAGEACEDCDGQYLEQVGLGATPVPAKKKKKKASLKRKVKKKVTEPPVPNYDDVVEDVASANGKGAKA